jgi:hypothetical protein
MHRRAWCQKCNEDRSVCKQEVPFCYVGKKETGSRKSSVLHPSMDSTHPTPTALDEEAVADEGPSLFEAPNKEKSSGTLARMFSVLERIKHTGSKHRDAIPNP